MVTFEQFEEVAVPIGARLVGELGGFLPFAVVADAEGDLEQLAADVGKPDPAPAEVYEFLVDALAAGARQGRYSGVALVLHEQPPPEIDVPEDRTIHAFIDIGGSGAISVFVPYSEDEGGALRVGEVVRLERASYFFMAPADG